MNITYLSSVARFEVSRNGGQESWSTGHNGRHELGNFQQNQNSCRRWQKDHDQLNGLRDIVPFSRHHHMGVGFLRRLVDKHLPIFFHTHLEFVVCCNGYSRNSSEGPVVSVRSKQASERMTERTNIYKFDIRLPGGATMRRHDNRWLRLLIAPYLWITFNCLLNVFVFRMRR